jgi:hypothetical protein
MMNVAQPPKYSKRGAKIFVGAWLLGFMLQNYADAIAQRLAPLKPEQPDVKQPDTGYLDVETLPAYDFVEVDDVD